MAYVIAVCGAGGKTTYVFKKAEQYKNENLSVCITTTTKMWLTDNAYNIDELKKIEKGKIYIVANKDEHHLLPLFDYQYKHLCDIFDVIIIEADGSRMCPLKIPNLEKEPVITENVNEIVVVYGKNSIGRKLGIVCHRYNEFKNEVKDRIDKKIDDDTLVNNELIKKFYTEFYEKPLKLKFKNAKISFYLNDMTDNDNYKNYKNILLTISASGFSTRFGQNKLLYKLNNKQIYKIVSEKVIDIKKILIKKLFDKYNYDLKVDIAIVSQYDEILNDTDLKKEIIMIKNHNPNLGQSESIKIATKKYINYDAICFFNGDTPYLNANEISNMIFYYICSNKNIGAVSVDNRLQNPAIFGKKYFSNILNIEGDVGLKSVLDNNVKDCYVYQVDKKEVKDIDSIDDIPK